MANANALQWGHRPMEVRPRDVSMSIDEQRIVNALEAHVVEADTIQGSEISQQRQRNHVYYAGDRIGDEKRGRSDHVSMDVFDSVESSKAYYREAFSQGRRPIRFKSEHKNDHSAPLATEYVMDQFFEHNNGHAFLRDSLHDAFVAKRCVAKVEWMEDYKIESTTVTLPRQQMLQASIDPSVVNVNVQQENPDGTVTATFVREIDTSFVEIELIQPERYYRDPNVSYIKDAVFAGFQEDIPRWELVDEGYDPDEVMGLNLDYRFRQNEEDASRKAHDSTWSRQRRHKRPKEQEVVTVYTHYAYMDLSQYSWDADPRDNTMDQTRLYKFVWSQGKLLTLPETMDDETGEGEYFVEIEDGMPFEEWTQYKISHAEFGLCDTDLQAETQWTKSNLRRLIIDNAAMGNTSRWKAKHRNVKNPRELLDNNIGSILWVNDMAGLEPLETPPLSPLSFQLLETLDVEKENRSGLSRLAKGMNTDAISHQNAADMIQRLTNASNRRTMQGVRDYAEDFLKPIFIRIYNLGVKYDNTPRPLEVQGRQVMVNMQQMPPRKKIKIQAALTPDEGREQAYFRMNLHTVMKEDEDLAMMYGPMEKYNNLAAIMDMMDVDGHHEILLSPASPEYQQRMQQNQQMIREAKQQQERLTYLQTYLDRSKDRREWFKENTKAADIATDNLRADEELDHTKWKDRAEIFLEHDQQRAVGLD